MIKNLEDVQDEYDFKCKTFQVRGEESVSSLLLFPMLDIVA